MLKQSDFFSAMTQSNAPVWQGEWQSTLSNLPNVDIKSLYSWFLPGVLNKYLPYKNNDQFYDRAEILSKLFLSVDAYIRKQKITDDPEILSLITKLVVINKLYNEIPDEFKNSILIFGNLNDFRFRNTIVTQIAKNLGYDTVSYLAQNLIFSPDLIMQIARGMDVENDVDISGRQKLEEILSSKYPSIYDILLDPEKTKNFFGDNTKIGETAEINNQHILYPFVKNPFYLPIDEIRNYVCSVMDVDEYIDFFFKMLNTTDNFYALLKFPSYGESLSQEYALSFFDRLSENGDIKKFMEILNNQNFQKLMNYSDDIIEVLKYTKVDPEYKKFYSFVRLYQLLLSLLSSNFNDQDSIKYVKRKFGDNFDWVDLDKNTYIAINGFASDEQLQKFFTKHPDLVKSCRVDFPGKKHIIEAFSVKVQEEIIDHKQIYEHAIKKGIVKIFQLDVFYDLMDIMLSESQKMGVDPEEFKEYAKYIKVYLVNILMWNMLCEQSDMDSTDFLGHDMNEKSALWLPKGIDHNGQASPIIICRDENPNQSIANLFKNLDIRLDLMREIHIAHESAHSMHYLVSPDMQMENYSTSGSDDMESYFGSVPENIAYAHGELPFFYNMIKEEIADYIETPVVQNAIKEWIFTNILSSDDAPLQGFYRSRDIMKQAMYLQQQFNVDIQEYIEKKKQRQIYKMLDMLYQDQQNNKMEILKDLHYQIKEIDSQILVLKPKQYIDQKINDQIYELYKKRNELEKQKELIFKNKLVIDIDDAAEALTAGFIREYFMDAIELLNQRGLKYPSSSEIEEHTNFLMDATDLSGTSGYRPLTSEILPFTTTQTDRSGGFYPHLEEQKPPQNIEASILKKLVRLANKVDYYATDISDRIESLIK